MSDQKNENYWATQAGNYRQALECAKAENERLRAVLKPFADAADAADDPRDKDASNIWERPVGMEITFGNLRRAREALGRDAQKMPTLLEKVEAASRLPVADEPADVQKAGGSDVTSLGSAFLRFKNAHAKAWVHDTEDNMSGRDRKSTKEAWEKAEAAERELRALLVPKS